MDLGNMQWSCVGRVILVIRRLRFERAVSSLYEGATTRIIITSEYLDEFLIEVGTY